VTHSHVGIRPFGPAPVGEGATVTMGYDVILWLTKDLDPAG
jgi:hypothetical protein